MLPPASPSLRPCTLLQSGWCGIWWPVALAFLVSVRAAEEAPTVAPLTTAAAIRELPTSEAARHLPVRLRGVVTLVAQNNNIVLHDGSDAIWVPGAELSRGELALGDFVTVTGRTDPGGFAPKVRDASITKLGPGILPPPAAVSYDDLATTKFDCHRVTVSGVVRTVRPVTRGVGTPGIALTLMPSGGQRIFFVIPNTVGLGVDDWIDAEVRATGVCFYTSSERRQAFAVRVVMTQASDLVVTRPPTLPAEVPPATSQSLLQYSPRRLGGHRVRLTGIVTHQVDGQTLFLSDAAGGIVVRLASAQNRPVGAKVQAVGFVARGDYSAVLEDAVLLGPEEGENLAPPAPRQVSVAEAFAHDAELIAVRAVLAARIVGPKATTMTLQADGQMFSAQLEGKAAAAALPSDGSEVLVAGINRVFGDNPNVYQREWLPCGFELLVRTPADVTLLKEPSRSAAERLAWTVAAAALALLLPTTVFAARAARRVRRQRLARLQAEAEFKAVLAERNRLAREIHDTLAQGFTAVFAQLELIRRKLSLGSLAAMPHVETARDLVRQSLAEARQSIFNLRPRVLEDDDLIGALSRVGRQLTADGVRFDCRASGETRRLAPEIEGDLLRIGQEAIANAVRHGHASRIDVTVKFEAKSVSMEIADDGSGFDPQRTKPRSADGGMGLENLRERARHREGELTIQSAPGSGTRITATFPVPIADGAVAVA